MTYLAGTAFHFAVAGSLDCGCSGGPKEIGPFKAEPMTFRNCICLLIAYLAGMVAILNGEAYGAMLLILAILLF